MRLCSEMDYFFYLEFMENAIQGIGITDIPFYKMILLKIGYSFQVVKISGISKEIIIYNRDFRISFEQIHDEILPDKSCPAGNQYVCHGILCDPFALFESGIRLKNYLMLESLFNNSDLRFFIIQYSFLRKGFNLV